MMYLLLAASPQTDAPPPFVMLLPVAAILAIFYLIVYRPMLKQRKELQKLVEKLDKGDRVVTTGGIYGEVTRVEGSVIFLKVADSVRIRVAKSAIAGLESPPERGGGK